LHGQKVKKALEIVQRLLDEILPSLLEGKLEPNFDSSNHIFKIICGAGNHSLNKQGILKFKVQELL
jgi:hypothetical protein